MNSIANRLKELRDYKIRSQYVKDRLYGIDGKAYELEDLLRPGSYQKFWMEELRERQTSIEEDEEWLKAWAQEEEQELLTLIKQLRRFRQQEILRLYFVEAKSITETTAEIYRTEIETGRTSASRAEPRVVRTIQRSYKNLEAIQAALEAGDSVQR